MTTIHDQPTSVQVPHVDTEESIATLQQFSSTTTIFLTNLTEARPLIRTELTVKTLDGEHLISGLLDCAATLDFVYEDFVRRFALHNRKSMTKTPLRLANGQRVTSSTVCDVTFEIARHEFQQTFYVLRDLRAANLILGLY
jgi:predicted lipase